MKFDTPFRVPPVADVVVIKLQFPNGTTGESAAKQAIMCALTNDTNVEFYLGGQKFLIDKIRINSLINEVLVPFKETDDD